MQTRAGASEPDEPTSPRLEPVRDNLYVLTGGGINSAVFVTDLGVFIVDTKPASWGPATREAIQTVTNRPVMALINTHSHDDHTGGNESFGTAVEILAHIHTRANMERMKSFSGERMNFVAKRMFQERMSLGTGTDRIDLLYFGAGHTDGDAWVVFPSARAMHVGDMFADKRLPVIDRANGGSGIAYPETLARALAVVRGVDVIITGHAGRLMTIADLAEYASFTRDFRDFVVDGFNRGLSVSEVVDGWRIPERYRDYAESDRQLVLDNVEQMFRELAG
jgi:cyclase